MAVNQRRRQPLAGRRYRSRGSDLWPFWCAAEPGNTTVAHGQRSVLDYAVGACVGTHGRDSCVSDQKVPVRHGVHNLCCKPVEADGSMQQLVYTTIGSRSGDDDFCPQSPVGRWLARPGASADNSGPDHGCNARQCAYRRRYRHRYRDSRPVQCAQPRVPAGVGGSHRAACAGSSRQLLELARTHVSLVGAGRRAATDRDCPAGVYRDGL